MKDLIVNITPATVTANFEDLHAYLSIEVSKYDIKVTEEKVKDAKKLATELNSVSKGINDIKKKQLAILEAPAKEFKRQIAELNDIVQGGRTKILSQVKIFEDEVLQDINDLIVVKELDEYIIQDLSEDYYGVNFSDLILLGSVTKSGALTKKVNDEIVARVASAKQKQKLDEADAEKEALRLEAEVNKRVAEQRERDIRAEADKKIDEAKESFVGELIDSFTRPTETPLKEQEAPIEDKIPTPEGKKLLTIDISFNILVRESAQEDKVLLKMRELLSNAGIPELSKITIRG